MGFRKRAIICTATIGGRKGINADDRGHEDGQQKSGHRQLEKGKTAGQEGSLCESDEYHLAERQGKTEEEIDDQDGCQRGIVGFLISDLVKRIYGRWVV